ncbi:unnamed protein product [Effrenium voratum]|nr:unnamed protein product [Effrenium voratum]
MCQCDRLPAGRLEMVTAGTSSASVGSKADLPSAPGDGEDEVGKQLRLAMKAAAVQYGRQAARQGAALAKSAAVHVYMHVEASAWTVKGIAFTVSLFLFVVSLLSIFNVFYALAHPLYYLLATYNLGFAVIIFIMEGPSELQCDCPAWEKLQRGLFGWATFLASRTGRALYYFFVGTLNMFMMPHDWLWTMIYFALGASLAFVGLLSLLDRYGCTTVFCPVMRSHVRGKHPGIDLDLPQIENGHPHGLSPPHGNYPRSPARSPAQGGPARIQEMEQLLNAEMGQMRPY